MPKHAVIYIFGLSDHNARGQELAVKLWKVYGVRPETFHMYWNTPEPFGDKLERLLTRIDDLAGQGHAVSLVGTSAGASVAIAAYAARPQTVHAVVCICGKLRSPETISPYIYRKNPAFQTSMSLVAPNLKMLDALQRDRILSLRPFADYQVPPADTIIPGAHNRRIFSAGHAFSIGTGILFYVPFFLWFIKRPKMDTDPKP